MYFYTVLLYYFDLPGRYPATVSLHRHENCICDGHCLPHGCQINCLKNSVIWYSVRKITWIQKQHIPLYFDSVHLIFKQLNAVVFWLVPTWFCRSISSMSICPFLCGHVIALQRGSSLFGPPLQGGKMQGHLMSSSCGATWEFSVLVKDTRIKTYLDLDQWVNQAV